MWPSSAEKTYSFADATVMLALLRDSLRLSVSSLGSGSYYIDTPQTALNISLRLYLNRVLTAKYLLLSTSVNFLSSLSDNCFQFLGWKLSDVDLKVIASGATGFFAVLPTEP